MEESDVLTTVKEILETLLGLMGIEAAVEPHTTSFASEEGEAPLALDIKGEDLGILIGRRGQTLASLQYILQVLVSQKTGTYAPLIVDVEGYKARRYENLRALARRIADQVRASRCPFALEPMPPYERRLIHLALASDPDVTTESTGIDEARKVVIKPKN
ncbi:MAG: R3H domain-containing nucleic acid-binding protein [Chloroflexota bacterium]